MALRVFTFRSVCLFFGLTKKKQQEERQELYRRSEARRPKTSIFQTSDRTAG